MKWCIEKLVSLCVLVAVGCLLVLGAASSAHASAGIASLYSKQGEVFKKRPTQEKWSLVEVGEVFHAGDAVRAGKHARAGILFRDGFFTRISNNASITFHPSGNTQAKDVELTSGKAHFLSRNPRQYPRIKTPIVSASVRGTEFVVEVSESEARVAVLNGVVECNNQHGSVRLREGQQAFTQRGKGPVKTALLSPRDAVQWALYYPMILDYEDYVEFLAHRDEAVIGGIRAIERGDYDAAEAAFRGQDWGALMGRSLMALERGDESSALEIVSQHRGDAPATFMLHEARLRLSHGQVAEAEQLLEKAAEKIRSSLQGEAAARLLAGIRAQQSILHLIRDDKQRAEHFAAAALDASGDAVSALLAMSYVHQSAFALEDAKVKLAHALQVQPHHAFARARLAEVELSFGDVERAEELVKEALRLEPDNAYAMTIMGFVELFLGHEQAAAQYFSNAISMDSTSALPHLGRGLVYAAEGSLQRARQEFMKAVHLEPHAAIYRSYLGKAFFEDGEATLANQEYSMAIKLDPRDPTPYLYRGFSRLSQNRVVPALRDVERSIERNDNRAVYRSSLLLDKDVGVRSASLAQVFNALGFSEAARVEAVKSINRDYSNFSAHRLLAESQNTVFEADAAFSERRIADLLAPLSFNMFFSPGGEATLNEYNALFDKSEERTAATFIHDSRDDIYAAEVFQAAKEDNLGYLIGVQSDFRDGSKSGDFGRDYRLRAASQYQISYRDRLMVEASSQFREIRDRHAATQESEFKNYHLSGGYHRRISPETAFIMQTLVSHDDNDFHGLTSRLVDIEHINGGESLLFEDEFFLDERTEEELTRFRTAGQLIHDSDLVSGVFGYQLFSANSDRTEKSPVFDDYEGLFTDIDRFIGSEAFDNLHSNDVYAYSTWHLADWADVTAGITHTELHIAQRDVTPFVGGTRKDRRFNPKVGLTLYPHPDLLARVAYFETLRKASFEDQASIEPTLVGAFSQRFNDLPGTTSRNLGVGLDWKLPGSTYLGANWTRRDLAEPGTTAATIYQLDFDQLSETYFHGIVDTYKQHIDQDIARAYFYKVLSSRMASTVDYLYTMQDLTDPEIDQEISAHAVAMALRYFDPSGFFAFGRGTWRQQDRRNSFFLEDGVNDFWTYDAGIGYRLPERHGSIVLEFLNLTDEKFALDQSLGFTPFIDQEFAVRLVAAVNF